MLIINGSVLMPRVRLLLALGDGFVPTSCAFLDGATQLTFGCFHSGGLADPWPKDDWYGAERNVDA